MTEGQLQRFMAKVDKTGEGGCWLWTRSLQGLYGSLNDWGGRS